MKRNWARERRGIVLACVASMLALATAASPALAAPDPGGDASANVPVPPPGKYFGLNSMSTPPDGVTHAEFADLARTAGANAARGVVNWQAVEPQRNRWSDGTWIDYDRFYETVTDAGMTPIMVLGNAPWWARSIIGMLCPSNTQTCAFPPRPSMDGEWAQFAAEAARRYPDAIFEIWNEPNLWSHWNSGPNPWRYARLQSLAYDAIKAVNPDATVLSAGFANTATSALLGLGPMGMKDFVRRAYNARHSIKDHIDGLAFHPYPGLAAPTYQGPMPDLGPDSGFARGFAEIREARDAAGDADLPLFVTETGISTDQGVTRAEQLDATRRIYRKAATMDDVMGVVIHRIAVPSAQAVNPLAEGFAWLQGGSGNPPQPYPVYCGFAADAGNSHPGC